MTKWKGSEKSEILTSFYEEVLGYWEPRNQKTMEAKLKHLPKFPNIGAPCDQDSQSTSTTPGRNSASWTHGWETTQPQPNGGRDPSPSLARARTHTHTHARTPHPLGPAFRSPSLTPVLAVIHASRQSLHPELGGLALATGHPGNWMFHGTPVEPMSRRAEGAAPEENSLPQDMRASVRVALHQSSVPVVSDSGRG